MRLGATTVCSCIFLLTIAVAPGQTMPITAAVPCPIPSSPAAQPASTMQASPPAAISTAQASPLVTSTPAVRSTPTTAYSSVAPLRASPASLQLNAGMCTRVLVSGGAAPYSVVDAHGNVTVTSEGEGAFLFRGLINGSDTANIVDASGSEIDVPILVAPDAGALPPSVAITVAGRSPPSASFEAGALAVQLAREAQLRPGSRVVAIDPRSMPATLALATPWSATIPVAISGRNHWRDVQGSVLGQINYVDLPALEPTELFFSDDPEEVRSNQSGVVFRQTLQPRAAVRLFAYSQLDAPGQVLYVILQSSGTSHIQVLGDAAGPGYYDDAGHKATLRYLLARRSQQSIVTTVSSGDPLFVQVAQPTTDVPRVVTAIYDMRLLDGDPADVLVAAARAGDDPRSFLEEQPQPALEDKHLRTGVYPLGAMPALMLSASIGMQFDTPPDGTSTRVGSWAVPPIVGKRYLIGDYGVVRPLSVTLTNVSSGAGWVYLYETPSRQGATTTVLFDDEQAAIELPCLQAPGRYLIRKFSVPPGGTPLVVTGTFMTDGGSEYPIELGLSLDPPIDPPENHICTPARSGNEAASESRNGSGDR